MIDATTYQTVSVVLAGLSVSLAAFYYMMTLRNTKRQQEVTLETRQAQLFMQLYQDLLTEDNMRSYLALLNME